ncbi:hypothetical protein E2C01_029540 [Portunus trituberculatus]|uniref:Uncharacterized protein n=1 Tax=Portunus trituberculatus TaxID=210409 RepID=A0A5B7ET75_PORTR|nr:hypothetical protein [Portunus trituberculatus]
MHIKDSNTTSRGGVPSNIRATLSPSLQVFMEAILRQEVALTLLKNVGSSSRSARDRVGSQPITAKLPRLVPHLANSNPENLLKWMWLYIEAESEEISRGIQFTAVVLGKGQQLVIKDICMTLPGLAEQESHP